MMRLASAAALAAAAYAAVPADYVPTLPGFGAPPSKWYSGYLDAGNGKHLHYILVESTNNPATDPVTAWFNGGPGCSSLEGLFAEHGQLLVNESDPSTLYVNPYAWSNISNVLFIEAPACVGYSYADTIDGCSHNDTTQAADNYNALLDFFGKYPEYQPNDFYITGESYAGIYVPTLAKAVTLGNAGGASITINLKGIAVGNGCVGMAYGQCSFDYGVEINNNVPYFRGHGLIAGSLYNAFQKACPVGTDPVNPSTACQDAITEAHNEVGNVNIYDIYGDCITGPSSSATRIDAATGLEVYKRAPVPKRLGGPNECIDETIATYIGSAAVAAALHVPSTLNWAVCGSNASFAYNRTEPDERIDVYPVFAGQIRVLIFNGEADACVPYIDNENWVASMNYTVKAGWHAWTVNDQVAGYSVTHTNGFNFATVKGAGHMVPQFKPAQAWALFNSLLSGTDL